MYFLSILAISTPMQKEGYLCITTSLLLPTTIDLKYFILQLMKTLRKMKYISITNECGAEYMCDTLLVAHAAK